jgi:hypothetical protein
MPIVHGIEFNANQSELVKDLIRELLKDGECAVYALPHMKPYGELRMAPTPPAPGPRHQRGVFLRIRPGIREATLVRPMNAKAGQPQSKITKFSQAELLEMVRIWRKQTAPRGTAPPVSVSRPEKIGPRVSTRAGSEQLRAS